MQINITVGQGFKLEASRGDFMLRIGRREIYWMHATGWSFERVQVGSRLA